MLTPSSMESSHKIVVQYFSKERFIMTYQLPQIIYSMPIVASTCHWVFSYEVVNVIIFQCINLFFPFPVHVPIQCRHCNHQWILVMLCTCKCDEKCCGSQLSDHCKNIFLVLLQIFRRDANVFEIYVSNIIF
jgi:hypothetical protein